jgi:hypothetical protein
MKTVYGKDYKFLFESLPNEIKDYCKFFVLHKLSGKNKMSTINVRYRDFLSIITNVIERTSHKSIYVITTEDLQNEIARRDVGPSTTHNFYQALYQVYGFFTKNYKLNLPVELDVLNSESVRYKNLEKQSDNKLADIPDVYFDKILNTCLGVMRDKNADNNERMLAAAIVFISQTGLRLGDFLALTTDRLHEKKLSKSGNVTHYVHFQERKPSKETELWRCIT